MQANFCAKHQSVLSIPAILRKPHCSLFSSCSNSHRRQNREPGAIVCEKKGFGSPASRKPGPTKKARNDSTAQLLDTASPSRQPEAWQEQQPVASTSEDEEVPEEISARILRRILFFAGVPTFTGFVSLPLFWYLKVVQHLEIPTWAVYIASVFTFGAGLLGITYGALSASWSTAEGSVLGIEQFKKNLPFALDRMRGR